MREATDDLTPIEALFLSIARDINRYVPRRKFHEMAQTTKVWFARRNYGAAIRAEAIEREQLELQTAGLTEAASQAYRSSKRSLL